MSVDNWFTAAVSASLSLVAFNVHAEMGMGIAQDPSTGQIVEEVYQDWQEGIVLHPETGNYIITYKTDGNSFSQIVFEPATKIAPTIVSTFRASEKDRTIQYRYALRSGRESKQEIVRFQMLISTVVSGSQPVGPRFWAGLAVPTGTGPTLFLTWACLAPINCGVAPGGRLGGFATQSPDLPGVVTAKISGRAFPTVWLGRYDVSTPLGQRIAALTAMENDFVPRIAVAPRIPVGNPFSASMALSGIQKHVDTDLQNMKLVDPTLVSQLDRWLQAASDAAKVGNTKAMRADIEELRQLLKKEHQDMDKDDGERDDVDNDRDDKNRHDKNPSKSPRIDRLAARVLDFDLQYITKRLQTKEDRDKDGHDKDE